MSPSAFLGALHRAFETAGAPWFALAPIYSGPIRMRLGVEIDEVAASHVDRANTQTDGGRIQTIEVDMAFKCGPKSAGYHKGSWRSHPRTGTTRAADIAVRRIRASQQSARGLRTTGSAITALRRRSARWSTRSRYSMGRWRTPSENARSLSTRASGAFPAINAQLMAPNRNAGDPVGVDAGLRQRLVDSSLIGTKCSAAL